MGTILTKKIIKGFLEKVTATSGHYLRAKRWWRQVLYWGLTCNTVLGFWTLVAYAHWGKEETLPQLIALYTTVLTATLAAAGLRHFDKKLLIEKPPEEREDL